MQTRHLICWHDAAVACTMEASAVEQMIVVPLDNCKKAWPHSKHLAKELPGSSVGLQVNWAFWSETQEGSGEQARYGSKPFQQGNGHPAVRTCCSTEAG